LSLGWSLGEHGEWAKFSNYEVSTRVPLIIHVPGLTTQGLHTKTLVELVDVFPTLTELLNLGHVPLCPPRDETSTQPVLCTEGISLVPFIVNKVKHDTNNEDDDDDMGKKSVFHQYPRPGLFPTKQPNFDQPKLHEIRYMGYSVSFRFVCYSY
jgi:iduronate 2-sulfatase